MVAVVAGLGRECTVLVVGYTWIPGGSLWVECDLSYHCEVGKLGPKF